MLSLPDSSERKDAFVFFAPSVLQFCAFFKELFFMAVSSGFPLGEIYMSRGTRCCCIFFFLAIANADFGVSFWISDLSIFFSLSQSFPCSIASIHVHSLFSCFFLVSMFLVLNNNCLDPQGSCYHHGGSHRNSCSAAGSSNPSTRKVHCSTQPKSKEVGATK